MWPVGCEQTWYLQHWGHLPQTLFLLSPIWWLGSDNREIKGLGEVQGKYRLAYFQAVCGKERKGSSVV